jgi:hypothetical protein
MIYDNIFPCQVGDVNLTLWIGLPQNTHGGLVARAVRGARGFSANLGLVAICHGGPHRTPRVFCAFVLVKPPHYRAILQKTP